jgi:ATP-dependent Clp protease ATP-binding subunit ClpA
VTLMINELKQRLEEHMLELYFTDDASDFLMEKGYDPTFGARPLRRTIQKYVEDPLVEKLLREEVHPGDTVAIDVNAEKDRLSFEVVKSLTGAEQS